MFEQKIWLDNVFSFPFCGIASTKHEVDYLSRGALVQLTKRHQASLSYQNMLSLYI